MKPVQVDQQEIVNQLALKIANLEVQLATEQAARQAIVKYAEELEKEIEEVKRKPTK